MNAQLHYLQKPNRNHSPAISFLSEFLLNECAVNYRVCDVKSVPAAKNLTLCHFASMPGCGRAHKAGIQNFADPECHKLQVLAC